MRKIATLDASIVGIDYRSDSVHERLEATVTAKVCKDGHEETVRLPVPPETAMALRPDEGTKLPHLRITVEALR